MVHVILFEPEIAPNTGNIIRLCANTGAQLHLIHPLGFSLEDRKLRRAGLDYHETARVREHPDFETCLAELRPGKLYAFTTKASKLFHAVSYHQNDALVFGPETRGLPEEILARIAQDQWLRIPMVAAVRSLNLSNAVAVAVYEVWRQTGFAGAR